ncbi:MAG TPA: hypothetical protein P5069_13335 [Candidatus Hydrogenedentes bacterium]|nr:hypothetical protein [Candidatus Hydrogenedentota bacterium]HQL95559.1 hypothetical protein [Candidatus Hydrogenedentota bacterium]HRZ83434.1 hypothetical protein [Candidatus Hydrogenedentota bacterium]
MKLRNFWFRIMTAFAGTHPQAPGVGIPVGGPVNTAGEAGSPAPPKTEEPPHSWKSHGGARH